MLLDTSPRNCVLQSYHKTEPAIPDDRVEPKLECPFKILDSSYETESEYVVTVVSKFKDLRNLPDDLKELMPAMLLPLPPDYNLPPIPAWLDIEKLKKGQAFACQHMHGLDYADMLSLMFLFSSSEGRKPLIFTEKSHTPLLAEKRYLSTVLRVKSWYETEIWKPGTKGYKNLKYVRALHLHVSNKVNKLSADEVGQVSNLEEKLKEEGTEMLCPLTSTLKNDFKNNGPAYPIATPKSARIYINQLEMACTQFGFYGLMLLHPEKFAAKNATDEELSCFVHLWRYIGYMLGIQDEYNLCKGNLAEVKQRSSHICEYVLKPMMLQVNNEWEHMSRSAFLGIEKFTKLHINFESSVLYLCWVLGIDTPNLLQYVGWKEQILFSLTKFINTECHKVPWFSRFANYTLKKNLERAVKKDNRGRKREIK